MRIFENAEWSHVNFSEYSDKKVRFIRTEGSSQWSYEVEKVSANNFRRRNEEILAELKRLVLNDYAPFAIQQKWEKFIEEQQSYFDKLHPSDYRKNRELRGWETISMLSYDGVSLLNILVPRKFQGIKEWRAYDSKKVVYGEILDEFTDVNGVKTIVLKDGKKMAIFEDEVERRTINGKLLDKCPFSKGEEILRSYGRVWYKAGEKLPPVKEYLD